MPSLPETSHLYARFESLVHDRLLGMGFEPAEQRFPLASHELRMLGYQPLVRVRAGRSHVVALARGDALVLEQLRYLSDQFYNALLRERNEIQANPTLLRGVCIFAYERPAEPRHVRFLMERVRPRTPFAAIRSLPWVLDLASGRVQRPGLTRSPFPEQILLECAGEARRLAAAGRP